MPVLVVDGKRINVDEARVEGSVHNLVVDGRAVSVRLVEELSRHPTNLLLRTGERIIQVSVQDSAEGRAIVRLNGRPFEVHVEHGGDSKPFGREKQVLAGPVIVMAPMAGRIVALKTEVGSEVSEGDALAVLEAMKMENEIAAPRRGIVKEVFVRPGDAVKTGDNLFVLD